MGVLQINEVLPVDSALLCFASFERRCYTLAQNIKGDKYKKAYVFRNVDPPMDKNNSENFYKICDSLENFSAVEVNLDLPVVLADKMFLVILEIIHAQIKNIIIDISTFTHEALLILLKIVYVQRFSFDSIFLLYNGAAEYATWLSMGCRNIRNVIGFPGLFNPAYKNHLIVLTGFEKERATKLVELFEPDILSIGYGSEPTDKNHLETMQKMKEDFNDWFGNIGLPWTKFDFSCTQIDSTMNQVTEIINNGQNENIILVPLNTKLSTISVALIALQNKRIQIVYPIPETYNLQYSRPSDNFTVINLKKVPGFYDYSQCGATKCRKKGDETV